MTAFNKKTVLQVFALAMVLSPVSAAIDSTSEINYDSNDPFFSGNVFTLGFTGDGSTDKVNVFVENADLETQLPEGNTLTQSIEIDAENTETQAKYGFRDIGLRSIYNYEAVTLQLDKTSVEVDDWQEYIRNHPDVNRICDIDSYYATNIFDGLNPNTKVFCLTQGEQIANVAEIGSDPDALFQTDWSISNGDTTYTRTISNGQTGDGTTTRIGNDVIIDWKGSIGTGENAPIPTDELIAYSNTEGYRVIERRNYDNFIDQRNNMQNLIQNWGEGATSRFTVENQINTASSTAYQPHSNTEFNDVEYSGTGFENGALILEISSLRYPQFSIHINACDTANCNAFLQVQKSVGEPRITEASGGRVPELGGGTVNTEIENVGEAEGQFAVRLSQCSNGFSFSGVTKEFNLQDNERRSANLPVSFDSSSFTQKEVSGSCTVEVTETTSQDTDTETVSLTGVQQNECSPGEQFVETDNGRDIIKECTGNGLNTRIIETCATDEFARLDGTTYECVSDENPPTLGECDIVLFGETTVTNPFCAIGNAWDDAVGFFGQITVVLDALVTLITGIVAYAYSKTGLRDLGVSENEMVVKGLSYVLAGMASLLVYNIFSSIWVKLLILVGFVTYLYVKNLIPGV